jgi:hypothetical protein
MFRTTHNERYALCVSVQWVWVAWTAVDFTHLQVSVPSPGNNGCRDISSISLIPGFNLYFRESHKRIIWNKNLFFVQDHCFLRSFLFINVIILLCVIIRICIHTFQVFSIKYKRISFYLNTFILYKINFIQIIIRVVSHIPKFGDDGASSKGDATSLAGDAAYPWGD